MATKKKATKDRITNRYRSLWVPMPKEELAGFQRDIRHRTAFKKGWQRVIDGTVHLVVVKREWSFDYYVRFGDSYTPGWGMLRLGGMMGSWENLAFRAAVKAVKRFIAKVEGLHV